MSVEAVYGAEWYNNKPTLTDNAAWHNCTLPFTRNVIGPMDYTPCTFTNSQHPHITTDAHELALLVIFESALQHLADRPEGYRQQPVEVQNLSGIFRLHGRIPDCCPVIRLKVLLLLVKVRIVGIFRFEWYGKYKIISCEFGVY